MMPAMNPANKRKRVFSCRAINSIGFTYSSLPNFRSGYASRSMRMNPSMGMYPSAARNASGKNATFGFVSIITAPPTQLFRGKLG